MKVNNEEGLEAILSPFSERTKSAISAFMKKGTEKGRTQTHKKRETGFPVSLKLSFSRQSRISISLPQQTGMGWPALMCSVRLQI